MAAPVSTPGMRRLGGLTARVEHEYTVEPLSQPAVHRDAPGAASDAKTQTFMDVKLNGFTVSYRSFTPWLPVKDVALILFYF